MANNDSEKLLFRLNHIIPKGLSLKIKENENIAKIDATDGPQEIFFQMTWGKIAGIQRNYVHLLLFPPNKNNKNIIPIQLNSGDP
jgi:hypothetical protein